MITIATSGGGTAGHVLPCIALYPNLKKYFDKIIHLGGNGIELTLIPEAGIPLFTTKNVKFDRANMLSNLKIPFILSAAVKEAKEILVREKVNVVFTKGGYASIPTVLAAHKLNIPIVIHESDYNMGLANKLASRFASIVLTSFKETKGGIYVGNPIRESIFEGDKSRAIEKYNLHPLKPTILIFGGSSGAHAINKVVFNVARRLTEKYNVVHILGAKEKTRLFLRGYVPLSYASDIEDLYAVANVIIMRGGANSLQEVTILGKNVICIPLPKSKHSRGDQEANAKSYAQQGLIDLLPQSLLTEEELLKRIEKTINKKERPINRNTPNEEIVKKIASLIS